MADDDLTIDDFPEASPSIREYIKRLEKREKAAQKERDDAVAALNQNRTELAKKSLEGLGLSEKQLEIAIEKGFTPQEASELFARAVVPPNGTPEGEKPPADGEPPSATTTDGEAEGSAPEPFTPAAGSTLPPKSRKAADVLADLEAGRISQSQLEVLDAQKLIDWGEHAGVAGL